MLLRIGTSGLVAALFVAGCGDDFKPAPVGRSTQTKTEGRAARAITARYNCTHVVVRGSPALLRELERRRYCLTSDPVLTVIVRPGSGSRVTYGNASAAKLIQTRLVQAGARNRGVVRSAALDKDTVMIRTRKLDAAAAADGIERFKAP
jgi:hypothetical protein